MLTLLSTLAGAAQAAPSASLEQVRNGLATATSTPAPAWVTGNAGASNSHFLESHSIPYRTVMNNLPTDGTVIELVVAYNVKRSGSYAIDFLTQYQRVLPHVLFSHNQPEAFDPLAGVTGVSSTVSTTAIPAPTQNLVVDPDGANAELAAPEPATSMNALSAAERVMTLYGGTLLDATYVAEGDVNLATSSSETQLRIRFTADSPKAVLAWGGHIACRWDWGFNADGTPRSAGGISGSSYHMRLVGWNLGSVGNQDRSMSTDAVYPVPQCGVSNLGPFCANSINTHSAPTGMETYGWTLFDNTSGASIVGSTSGSSVTVNAGTGGSYGLLLTTGASGFTKQCQGAVTVLAPATADAGLDQVLCATLPQVQLAGVATGGTGTWSGGAGTYSPNASTLDAIYTPTAAEVTAGGVTLTLTSAAPAGICPSASDAMRVTIQRVATANAGADLTVCASAPAAQLAGSVGGSATAGTWSGGSGTFTPSASALNAIYTPSVAEIAAGSVTLILTTAVTAGPCGQVSDEVTIQINAAATASAGADQDVCSSSPQVQLAGAVGGGATAGSWSGGGGTFAPNANALNASYSPSAAEIAAGGVTLTLTSNDPAGPCGSVSDAMRINIRPAAIVSAGADQVACSSSPRVTLQGSVSGGAASGIWSGGGGTFNPGASTLLAQYTPSAAEIAAGGVTLTLTSTAGAGACPPVSDQVMIVITAAVTVNAGPDQIVCPACPEIQLAGTVGNGATGGTWSGGGGTFAPNANALDARYTLSATELLARRVTLTLTTNDPSGPCPAVSDQMKITVDVPTVTVPNRIVCDGIAPVRMCANAANGVAPYTYLWSTGATSSCISVVDTGSYVVTITDAKGCQASASGVFGHRECTGMLAHTITTCSSFMDGTGEDLTDVSYVVKDNIITSIAPGVFFYYTLVRAPSTDFTINIVQTKDNPSFPFCEVLQSQVSLFDQDCTRGATGVETSAGQASVDVHGATLGQVLIVSVKYSLKSLVGTYMDATMGCHYDFHTEVNGRAVDADPDGIQIGAVRPPAPPVGGSDYGDPSSDPNGETMIQRGDGTERGNTPARPDTTNGTLPDPTTETIVMRGDGTTRTGSATRPDSAAGITGASAAGTSTGAGRPSASSGASRSEPVPADPISGIAALGHPTPNPFSGTMRMSYAVSAEGERVEISVFDLAGRRMKALASGFQSPGIHTVSWDGRDESGARVRKGMYFVHMRVGRQAQQVRVAFVN